MFKVIIVDDESYICELIKGLIDWEKYDMEVAGVANNGIVAYRMIESIKPDIVITDIRMPGIDGLELIKKSLKNQIKINFVIISGYQDFQYAQKAIKYGVSDYITKPIEKEELLSTLKKIVHVLKKKRELMIRDQRNLDELKNHFILDMLVNKINSSEIQKLNRELEIDFNNEYFQVVIFKLDIKNIDNLSTDHKKTIMYEELLTTMHDELLIDIENTFKNVKMILNKNKIISVFNFKEGEIKKIEIIIKDIFNKLEKRFKTTHRISLTCAIGSIEREISNLNKSYEKALKALRARITIGTDRIIDIKDFSNNGNIYDIIQVEKIKEYELYIETFKIEDLMNWIDEILYIIKKSEIEGILIYDIAYEIISITERKLKSLNLSNNDSILNIEEVESILDEITNIDDLFIEVKNIVKQVCKKYKEHNISTQSRKPVEIAKEYISKHYMDDISLNYLADQVYLNPTYFSELFKKETGVKFSDYLINYRIDVAKEFLKNPKYKIFEITKMIGYTDSKYFSKLFKKIVGVSPKDYRKLYL